MSYDFSHATSREESNAEKYRLKELLFGTTDVTPLWVADMDIDTPAFVLDAIKKRLEHPVMGYEEVPRSALEAQKEWMQRAHNFSYEIEDVFYSHSVVASMRVAIEAFSKKGEGVIVQTPVYSPFFHSVLELERKLVKNPLTLKNDGSYTFDIEDLREKIDKDTKLLLLCSPHNPVGRVWKREELEAILNLCLVNNIVVFADEIHSDLLYSGVTHTPFATLNEAAREITLTAIGVGKTFNMAGFTMSSVVVQNRELKERFEKAYNRVHFAQGATLSHVAFEAAYREGRAWLEDLREHLYANYLRLEKFCLDYPDMIRITPIEGTYLAWLDCRGMGMRDKELRKFFIEDVKLGLNAGISFGREGSGFMRLNFAISTEKMQRLIKQLDTAFSIQCQKKEEGRNIGEN